MRVFERIATVALIAAGIVTSGQGQATCRDTGVQVQVLGSGGPGPSAGRASSGYLVWIDGVGRILVDAGGGTKDRFHAAGARLEDIELIALSHFHPDHSAELPAIVWPAGSQARLSGPTGGGGAPSISQFVSLLFGENGAFSVFGDRVQFDVLTVDVAERDVVAVWSADDILVRGVGVPHADIPTIAYRVDTGDASIVFSSDQNGSDPSFVDFIRGVDVLVIHMTVGEDASGFMTELHAKPSVWGQIATRGEVARVLVSHISAPSPQALQAAADVLRMNYSGPITIGEDLLCVEVGED